MKTLAFFSPLSPLRSGVAQYGDALAKELAKYYKIIFYIDEGYTPSEVGGLGDVRLHTEYRGKEDMSLFQASNGPLHAYMYPYLLKGGAAVTLHDRTLYDMAMKYWEGKPRKNFWRDLLNNEGVMGVRRTLKALPRGGGAISERILHNLYADENNKRIRFTFMKQVVRGARGIIAHSIMVRDAARSFGATAPKIIIPLAVHPAPPSMPKDEARSESGLDNKGVDSHTFVALAYGYIQRHKRMDQLLDAWEIFTKDRHNLKLALLGPRSPDYDIDAAVQKRELKNKVFIDDSYPGMDVVFKYIYSADLCVNLRYPVYGSSSYTLMQVLSAGRPCVVTGAETFAEFSSQMIIKIPYGEVEVEDLVRVFNRAKDNPDEMENLGKRAREFIELNCLWSHAGPQYRRFLEEIYKTQPIV